MFISKRLTMRGWLVRFRKLEVGAGAIVVLLVALLVAGSGASPAMARSANDVGPGTPTGANPGPGWIEALPVSSFINPAFSWLVGTHVGSSCSYSGELTVMDGQDLAETAAWANPSSCTLEMMTGTPTPAIAAQLAAGGTTQPIISTPMTNDRRATALKTSSRAPTSAQRAAWDHTATGNAYLRSTYTEQVGVQDEVQYNGTWSSSCNPYDTVYYNQGGGWDAPGSTGGGTCWAGIPTWDPGNYYDITEASASWSSAVYNDAGICPSSGATAYIWVKLYGRAGNSVLDYTTTPGGNCGAYLWPYIS
jgi:hypothetical protein